MSLLNYSIPSAEPLDCSQFGLFLSGGAFCELSEPVANVVERRGDLFMRRARRNGKLSSREMLKQSREKVKFKEGFKFPSVIGTLKTKK